MTKDNNANRRDFMGGVVLSALSSLAPSPARSVSISKPNEIPIRGFPSGNVQINSVVRRDETLRRFSAGSGVGLALTWMSDERQLMAVMEGENWRGTPKNVYLDSALIAVAGNPRNATFQALSGYHSVPMRRSYRVDGDPPYTANSALAVDGHIYQYLSTFGDSWKIRDENWVAHASKGVKLIYSPDNGRTWHNQDGSTPVVLETAKQQSRLTMAFWKEPDDAFSRIIFLQMGKDYQDNRDGYVYAYSHVMKGLSQALILFRTPKRGILDRNSYEYFSGLRSDGLAHWTRDIGSQMPSHVFTPGWSSSSIVYNAPLDVYMMAGSRSGLSDVYNETYKASDLGFWTAENPWGPWRLVHKEVWIPGNDPRACAMDPQISPKWISDDGKSFWVIWSDRQPKEYFRPGLFEDALLTTSDDKFSRIFMEFMRSHPYWGVNTQRFELIIK